MRSYIDMMRDFRSGDASSVAAPGGESGALLNPIKVDTSRPQSKSLAKTLTRYFSEAIVSSSAKRFSSESDRKAYAARVAWKRAKTSGKFTKYFEAQMKKKGQKKSGSAKKASGDKKKMKLSTKERERRSKAMKSRMRAGGGTLLTSAELARKKAAKKAAHTKAKNASKPKKKAKKNPVLAKPALAAANPVKKKAKKKKAKKNPIQAPATPALVPAGIVYEANEEKAMKKKGKKGKKKAARRNPAGKGPAKTSKKPKSSGSKSGSKGSKKTKGKKKRIGIAPGSPVKIKGTTKRKIGGKPMVINTNLRLVMGKPHAAKKPKKKSKGSKGKSKGKGKKKKLTPKQKAKREEAAVLRALAKTEAHRAHMLSRAAENPIGNYFGAQENPLTFGEVGVAGAVALFGYVATDFLDRFLATKATTDPTQATNAPLAGKNPMVLAGPPGVVRILAQLGVTVVGVVGSGMLHKSTSMGGRLGNAAFQGLAIGSIVHLGGQLWTHYVMAKLLATKDLGQRLYPSEIAADQVISAPAPTGTTAGPRTMAGPQGRTPYGTPRIVRGVGDTSTTPGGTPAPAPGGTPAPAPGGTPAPAGGNPGYQPGCGTCDETGRQVANALANQAAGGGDCDCKDVPAGQPTGSMGAPPPSGTQLDTRLQVVDDAA